MRKILTVQKNFMRRCNWDPGTVYKFMRFLADMIHCVFLCNKAVNSTQEINEEHMKFIKSFL